MPRLRFLIFDVSGAVLWVGLYVGLGYALHDQLAEAARLASRLGGWPIVIVVVALSAYVGVKVTRRQLFLRKLRIARISPEELDAKLTAGEPVFIVDLRHDLDVQAEPRMIRGALHMTLAALEQGHTTVPRDRERWSYIAPDPTGNERPGGAPVTKARGLADPAARGRS